jgi:RND family efflux transporter MFP subunit
MKRKGAYILIAIAAALIAFFIFQVARKHWQKDVDVHMVDKALPVAIASVVQHEFTDEISAVGTLKAKEIILLSPKVAGTVTDILVDIGDRVKAGEVVIRLDRTNFDLAVKKSQAVLADAEAAILQSKAKFEQAEKEYRRATELLKEKVVPQSRFDAAEAAFKTAREEVSSDKAQRDQAKATLEIAVEHLKDTEIRSPIAGTVVERNVEIGQAVAPRVDQTSLKADIDLPEIDFGRVAIGTPAVITVDAFHGHAFSGKVTVVNPMVDRKMRTFRVRIKVPNPSEKLVDGMFARVRLGLGTRTALGVPREALQRLPGSGTFYVFVVIDDIAEKRTVRTSQIGERLAEIIEGLSEGEKVVVTGAGRLRSGTKVVVEGKI